MIYKISIVLILAGLTVLANRAGLFRVHEVSVVVTEPNATFLLPKQQLMQQKLDQLKGQSMWQVNISQISQQLLSEDWIKDVQINRRIPFQLEVKIVPQAIVVLLMGLHGEILPTADDGKILSEISASEMPDLPILRGKIFLNSLQHRIQAVELVKQLPENGKFTARAVSEIFFSDKEGFQISLRNSRAKIQMGQDHFAQKASRVSQVMNYLDLHALEGRVIDATLSKKVLVRLRKDP